MKSILLILLSILCLALYSQAQTTMIPDTAFEQKLIQLGLDSDGQVNGQMVAVNGLLPSSLDVRSSNISSLQGIEAFTNLRYLYCSDNNLSNLDVSSNTNLRSIYCDNNNITSLDLSNNPQFNFLRCENNNISSLDFSNNPLMTDILCQNNNLSYIDVTNCTLLEDLWCHSNNLTSLDVTNCTILEDLLCSNNTINSLDISSNTDMFILYCDDNNLTQLDVTNNSRLQTLGCSNNNLGALNLSNNPNLRSLHCQSTNISTLDVSIAPLLIYINCSANNLSHLDVSSNPALWRLICSFNQLSHLDVSQNNDLVVLECNNNLLHYLNIKNNIDLGTGNGFGSFGFDGTNNLANMTICVHDYLVVSNDTDYLKDSSATYTETCPNSTLIGYVKLDNNNNCQVDSLETVVPNALIQINSSTDTIYTISNSLGYYTAEIDSGSYSTSIISPNPYTIPCLVSQAVSVDSLGDRDTIDWSLQETHQCPYLYASLSAPFLRMAGGGSVYTVSYCNNGTAAAYGAYVEVELDVFLNVTNTSIPIVSQNSNTYRFNLDTVDVNECGSFLINVLVDTAAQLGQTHCSQVHIYPDSLCNNTWSGPIIQAQGICNNNIIDFQLKNIGAPMSGSLGYSIFEDDVVMAINTFNLGANGTTTIPVTAQIGKTYRIEAQQAPGIPSALGPHIAYANVQNCNSSIATLNIPLIYYNGNPAPWIDLDCQANIAGYDPNDKTPQQIGYSSPHYIGQGTPLDYKIRFQNTGNDTAFNIVILDTISAHLDLSTLQMKTASHNYTWEIVNGHTLRVNFPNIRLVDSLTNEPLSHGFFRYEIQQKSNLPLGTIINNQAAIYFDYNLPIFTNTTWHTIGDDFLPQIVLQVDHIIASHIKINAYPNPFEDLTTIKVEGDDFKKLEIIVTDIAGRIVKTQQVQNQNQIQFYRDQLIQGIYFYQLKGNDKPIGSGKLIVR